MGQKPSNLGGRFNNNKHHHHTNHLPLTFNWLFRRHHNQRQQQQPQHQSTTQTTRITRHPNPEQPIRFHYKTTRHRKHSSDNKNDNLLTKNNLSQLNNNFNKKTNQSNKTHLKNTNVNDVNKCRIIKTQNTPIRTKSEPNLIIERTTREKQHRHRRRTTKIRNDWTDDVQQFGYEIEDIDAFLTKATIEKPANIPVVLAFPSILYQTRIGGYQAEISLPLGMVVNAVFKNQHWLYVQTPHAEEGYVSYAACLPLGIIPPPDDDDDATPSRCWENSTDVFPKPSGNMTDTEKLSSKSECGGGGDSSCRRRNSRHSARNAISICGERSVDRLYLRATTAKRMMKTTTRQTLLFITNDYNGSEKNALHVRKGDVVVLLGTHIKGWFWVKNKDGTEGFIPAAIAGHGFL